MKIIIVGCGKVGTTLAEQLNRENHDITLIDTDDEALKNISDNVDLMSVTGNGAIYQVQMEAGIQEADLMIATTNSDELNMLCCLIAKKAGNGGTAAVKRKKKRDTFYDEVELALAGVLARRVKVYNGKGSGGSIEIEFFGKDDLKKLAEQLEALE